MTREQQMRQLRTLILVAVCAMVVFFGLLMFPIPGTGSPPVLYAYSLLCVLLGVGLIVLVVRRK